MPRNAVRATKNPRVTAPQFDRACEAHKLTPSQIGMLTEYLQNQYGLDVYNFSNMLRSEIDEYISEAESKGAFDEF